MADPLHRQLLSQARRLARLDPKRPQQGNLRRAVSAAYYALFHSLIDHACRAMLGTSMKLRPYRDALARAFQHGAMNGACELFARPELRKKRKKLLPSGLSVHPDLRSVAQAFRDAQEKRHLADYDRTQKFTRSEVLALVRDVDDAMSSFTRIRGQPETRFFLTCLLAWQTLAHRR
jgi:uncharacterized protein (UPF0332 family)